MKMQIVNGFCLIEAAGLVISVPASDDAGGDDRAEITCGGSRVFVEYHESGPLLSAIERVSD